MGHSHGGPKILWWRANSGILVLALFQLPYGTMTDDAMLALDIASLQDDGFLLLWVTGRAMELGRRCLGQWGSVWRFSGFAHYA